MCETSLFSSANDDGTLSNPLSNTMGMKRPVAMLDTRSGLASEPLKRSTPPTPALRPRQQTIKRDAFCRATSVQSVGKQGCAVQPVLDTAYLCLMLHCIYPASCWVGSPCMSPFRITLWLCTAEYKGKTSEKVAFNRNVMEYTAGGGDDTFQHHHVSARRNAWQPDWHPSLDNGICRNLLSSSRFDSRFVPH